MLYSNACQYAIRALVHLAHWPEQLCLTKEIARSTAIPYHFLAKILGDLAQAGLVSSVKGRTGGFRLAKPAQRITLLEIRAAIDGVGDLKECAVGISLCDDSTPCPIHRTFKPIRERIKRYLTTTTLKEIAYAQEKKRRAISLINGRQKGRRR